MFDDIYDDGRFVFNAKDLKDAQNKGYGWARYQGFSKNDVMVKESKGAELNWSVDNDYVN
jgi:hypothetical protein